MNIREIGKRVRVFRAETNWTQQELADKARVSLGTVQALEDAPNRKNPRQTSAVNLEKIAKALGRTLDDLLKDRSAVAGDDPLLAGLNRDDDLDVARRYHDAPTVIRLRVLELLSGNVNTRAIALARRIEQFSDDRIEIVERLIAGFEAPNQSVESPAAAAKKKAGP